MKKILLFSMCLFFGLMAFAQVKIKVNPSVFDNAASKAFQTNVRYAEKVLSQPATTSECSGYYKKVVLPHHRYAKFSGTKEGGITLNLGRLYLDEDMEWDESREFDMFFTNGVWIIQNDERLNDPKVKRSFKTYYRGLRHYGKHTFYWQ